MQHDDFRRPSRWLLRVLEWDEERARYPNLWHAGMPRHVLGLDKVAGRLRLGDLIGVFHPASRRHPERSERWVGISRVVGLRRAAEDGFAWIDLETEHRFEPPLDLGEQPRRVFLCCDPGWPDPEVRLFRRVFDAAVVAGWRPRPEDAESEVESEAQPDAEPAPPQTPAAGAEGEEPAAAPAIAARDARPAAEPRRPVPGPPPRDVRRFAGVDYSGDMRDPRDGTWLALIELHDGRLRVDRLEATGRHGLERVLKNPDRILMEAEAIGLDFPFGLPLAFAEKLLGGAVPDEGWWALAKRLEKMSRPDYLVALQEFREAHGEVKRFTDERARAFSPLHRVSPDLGPMTFHGIRMIAEDRSRYALRPFENAQGRRLFEVYPAGFVRDLKVSSGPGRDRTLAVLAALAALDELPLDVGQPLLQACLARRDALHAVVAARQTAVAVLSGEADRTADDLAGEHAHRVRLEGWIYGVPEPVRAPDPEPEPMLA